ncbi:hypothetical protein [uncultured Gammaproteobacteria bacterium]|nr:hypothetical protein [uncultured Gammaproteobacteria bacterium]CAC9431352.1 hypothetical protein [uncultured Gammaproteobacteria bacterium]CAC9511872.1 hypothetical protein [uncultured Gammaproteobacteria bacterium]CAC9544159.1 hypothetical protein [uncultured Gammaproteobacteria bacterium]VVH58903.1 hypothetical protein BAZOLSSOX_3271 [uncultured Gammaproteobacteria bacterium]
MNKDSGNAIIQCKPTQSSRPAIIATDWNKPKTMYPTNTTACMFSSCLHLTPK